MSVQGAIQGSDRIQRLLALLARQEDHGRRSLSFTPPENVLSPLARVPFVLDLYGRYFFDHMTQFGSWSFFGALDAGAIEQEVLLPLLREMTTATFVDVRPLSGLHCMTIALAALCVPGDTVLTVPVANGGHICTASLAERLGMTVKELPMASLHDPDFDRITADIRELQPAAIYVDQSTQLFPIDPAPLREIIDRWSPATRLHYDTSHLTGLVLTGAMFNPLARGAHSIGGSTHKTLPGPHKGFLATNDDTLAGRFADMASTFVSHHHIADVVSLAVTLVELRHCNGDEYARRVISNARAFATGMQCRGADVAGADRGFTACHQVWVGIPAGEDPVAVAVRLVDAGVVVNKIDGLPGLDGTGLRFSLAEFTRMGAHDADVHDLVAVVADAIVDAASSHDLALRTQALRRRLRRPCYCYEASALAEMGAPNEIVDLCDAIVRHIERAP